MHEKKTIIQVKPKAQNDACISYAWARKGRIESNLFVKPKEQNDTCITFALARKGKMKPNVFVKPKEQNDACISYALARKGRMKFNFFSHHRGYIGWSHYLCSAIPLKSIYPQ